jgi:putative endonuclease
MKRTGDATGRRAEEVCLERLQQQGYQILAHRYRNPAQEIDIVACCETLVLFIEVKARPTLDQGREILTTLSPERYATAAGCFLADHPHYDQHDIRFDAMIVTPDGNIHHLENLWGV